MKHMKYLVLASLTALAFGGVADAAKRVKSYTKKSGTVVQSHQRTEPNKRKVDNWSAKGNYNPTTGKVGTKDPYPSDLK